MHGINGPPIKTVPIPCLSSNQLSILNLNVSFSFLLCPPGWFAPSFLLAVCIGAVFIPFRSPTVRGDFQFCQWLCVSQTSVFLRTPWTIHASPWLRSNLAWTCSHCSRLTPICFELSSLSVASISITAILSQLATLSLTTVTVACSTVNRKWSQIVVLAQMHSPPTIQLLAS